MDMEMEIEMESIKQYDPLRWPPDLQLAKVHMSCVCPGKDNIEGIQCPCCGRFQKIKTKKWYSRDIFKDFKNYGGGIPCYFSLLKYCAVSLLILSAIVILYHIYILENVCPKIPIQLPQCPGYQNALKGQIQCQSFIYVFKICDTKIILQYLNCKGQFVKEFIFFYLQLFSFLYLIAATLGMKIWLRKVNSQKIEREEKVYSLFSLMIKNIPKYYKIEELRREIEQMIPEAEICELFFLHEIAQLETNYKKLFDLHFVIEYIRESIAAERGQTVQHLQQLITQYRALYEKCQELKKGMNANNGRAIVVFNSMQQRDKLKQMLSINECNKLIFHTFKLVGVNTRKLHLFADSIHQPQQIIWKYVGQSSVTKTWVRIKTTFIGFGFMIVAFLLLYFPIIQIDVKNITNHSLLTSVLSVVVSIILQVLAIVYRQIILKILPDRHPSTRESESYFVVITTVVFHFFFYIIAPGTYFQIAKHIPANIKLKQLFVAVVIFLIMTFLVAVIDLRYRLFNSRRKKIISKWSEWGKFCQIKLHQQLRWPSFPIEFKIMVLLNIWSFNAFYVFQIPYLMFLFAVVITIIFWIDKSNIYRHYKMQVYQSIELELSVQRDYTIMFLVCVCCGYAVSSVKPWQYYFIGGIFIFSLIINFFIAYKTRDKRSKDYARALTLCEFVKAQSSNPKKSMLNDIITTQFKENVLIMDNVSTVSLGSATLQYGYKQMYENYLSQFKNKFITKLLLETYNYYDHPEYSPEKQIDEIRRITNMSNLQGNKDNKDDYYTNLYKTGKNRGNQLLKSSQKKTQEDKSVQRTIKQQSQMREESDHNESMRIDQRKQTLAQEQKRKNTQLKQYRMSKGQAEK